VSWPLPGPALIVGDLVLAPLVEVVGLELKLIGLRLKTWTLCNVTDNLLFLK